MTVDDVVEESGGSRDSLSAEFLVERMREDAHAAYDRREEELGDEAMRELERRVVLSVLDRKWREHLYEMDYLKEGIGLRSYAQRDPLVEYQREGYDLFAAMMDGIKEESVGFLFNLEVQVDEAPAAPTLDVDAATPVPTLAAADPADRRGPGRRAGAGARAAGPAREGSGRVAPAARRVLGAEPGRRRWRGAQLGRRGRR